MIRLAGVYCAFLAVVTFFSMIGSGWGVIFAPPKLDVPNANANRAVPFPAGQTAPFDANTNSAAPADDNLTPEDAARRQAVIDWLWLVLLTFIYGGTAFYLLRDGRLFYALLMREDPLKTKEPEPEVTTLNL